MLQSVNNISNELLAAQSQKPTILEGTSVRIGQAMAKVAVQVGSTKKAMERGKFLSENMKPIIARQIEIEININHAKGVVRCNAFIARELAELERLENLQNQTMIALGLAPTDVTPANS